MMNKKEVILEAKKVLSLEQKSINYLKKSFDNNFFLAVKKIYETKGKILVTGIGKSGHIANKISATLSSTGTPSHFIHPAEANHGDLGSIAKNDCLIIISNSGQTNELNGLINFSKRYNIPLISISSNKKGMLYIQSDFKIIYKKPIEACPNNLAPTSSTTMQLIIGDAIAVTLTKMRKFKKSQFGSLHPAGSLGKGLLKISEIMHRQKELPLVKYNEKMSNALIKMTRKSLGCLGVINENNNLIGIITDGDLRRNMNENLIKKKASEIMTKKPTTIKKLTLASEAIRIMNEKKITSLFVCNKKKPIGIVHIHDLIRIGY